MSNIDLLIDISNKLKQEIKIDVEPNDIKLIQINKDTKIYEVSDKNIKILYFRKSKKIIINSNKSA